jgi:anti-sigma regulatory factor (Ser/Thr protein kinase)
MNSRPAVANSHIKLTIEGRLANIGMVGAVTRILSSESGFSVMSSTEIELAVVEAVTNVIKYGLLELPPSDIELSLTYYEQYLAIEISDNGTPMPCQALDNADGSVFDFLEHDMDTWPTSGMGLSLIKAVMDCVEYSSMNGRNTLRLIKLMESFDATTDS